MWQMLERLPQWEMDMFELKTKLGRHSVVAVVGMTVMCKLTLLDNLKINPQVGYAATTAWLALQTLQDPTLRRLWRCQRTSLWCSLV